MTWQFLREDGTPTQEATILGALEVAQTPIAVWVEGSEILWKGDASKVLHEFAIWCAEEALKTVENPDPRSLEALRVKKLWVDGEATDEDLKNTRRYAWHAAHNNAAQKAAWATANAAAWSAAWFAAWEAAYGDVWDAACDAAQYASQNAARESQNAELERRLEALRSPPTKRRSRWEALLDDDSV